MLMSSNMMTREVQYLFIKEKLDSYSISTSFPLEVMPLLQNLIQRLEHESSKPKPPLSSIAQNSKPTIISQSQLPLQHYPSLEPALRNQLHRTMALNNNLHMQLIIQKEQIQSLKHCIDKMALETADSSKRHEVSHMISMWRDKERELVEELQVVKFKYNELVDFVMGEDGLEKMYIKKLMNHKKYEGVGSGIVIQQKNKQQGYNNRQQAQIKTNKNNSNNDKSTQELNSRITFKPGSSRKNSRTRINKTIDSKENYQVQQKQTNYGKPQQKQQQYKFQQLQKKLQQFQLKLLNRQKQIQRLQTVIRHDGPNLTKVITQFTHDLHQQQYHQLQQRITFLEHQNHSLNQQLTKNKLNGGRYQALIQQVDNSHAIIAQLKKNNALIKRQKKQQKFDLMQQKKQWGRSLIAAEVIKEQFTVGKSTNQLLIDNLKKKVDFYQKQLGLRGMIAKGAFNKPKGQIDTSNSKGKKVSKKVNKSTKSQSKQAQQAKQTLSKQSKVKYSKQPQVNYSKSSKQASSKKSEERQRYEDQIKLSSVKGRKEDIKVVKQRQSKKQGKKLPINQIIQEEEEDESYIKPQQRQGDLEQQQRGKYLGDGQQGRQMGDGQYGQLKKGQEQQIDNIQQNPRQQQYNEASEQQDSSQGESQSGQQQNETTIRKYQDTINQLSARCLQLKQQLGSKNQIIIGLQQIANRLMNKDHLINKDRLNQNKDSGSGPQPQSIAHLTQQSIAHLTQQVQTLSSLLNESEFEKEQLRRELIRVETLHKDMGANSYKEMRDHGNSYKEMSNHGGNGQFSRDKILQQELFELKQLLQQKDAKISDMREDNTTIQDQLLKALDRIRRLNDQIDGIRKQNQFLTDENDVIRKQNQSFKHQATTLGTQHSSLKKQHQKLLHQLSLNQSRLQEAAFLLKQQRERHSNTVQLSEVEKDEIIHLRKALVNADNRIAQMEQQLEVLREQNQRLVSQLK